MKLLLIDVLLEGRLFHLDWRLDEVHGSILASPLLSPYDEPFADAAATGDPVAAGAQIRPRFVGVDNAGGVDWIGVADGDVDADAVLRDPGLLRWVPQEAVDQVEVAPRRRRSGGKRRKKRAF